MTGLVRIKLAKLEKRRVGHKDAAVFPEELRITRCVRIETVRVLHGNRRLRRCVSEGTERDGRDNCDKTHVELMSKISFGRV
jgi:hypothetical protein